VRRSNNIECTSLAGSAPAAVQLHELQRKRTNCVSAADAVRFQPPKRLQLFALQNP
jgi:hypothetical protein